MLCCLRLIVVPGGLLLFVPPYCPRLYRADRHQQGMWVLFAVSAAFGLLFVLPCFVIFARACTELTGSTQELWVVGTAVWLSLVSLCYAGQAVVLQRSVAPHSYSTNQVTWL